MAILTVEIELPPFADETWTPLTTEEERLTVQTRGMIDLIVAPATEDLSAIEGVRYGHRLATGEHMTFRGLDSTNAVVFAKAATGPTIVVVTPFTPVDEEIE